MVERRLAEVEVMNMGVGIRKGRRRVLEADRVVGRGGRPAARRGSSVRKRRGRREGIVWRLEGEKNRRKGKGRM